MRPCLTLLFVLLLATPIHAQPPGAWQDATPMSLSLSGSPTIGSANAKVTIVKSMSYQCPYCARLAPTLSSVKARFGDDVRLVIKHNPLGFHQRALPAAKAAMAAHLQGKFWAYHDLLLSNQKTLEDDDLERFARSIGLTCTDGGPTRRARRSRSRSSTTRRP